MKTDEKKEVEGGRGPVSESKEVLIDGNCTNAALLYLISKGGVCRWEDMTEEMSGAMLDACLDGLVTSCYESGTWRVVSEL